MKTTTASHSNRLILHVNSTETTELPEGCKQEVVEKLIYWELLANGQSDYYAEFSSSQSIGTDNNGHAKKCTTIRKRSNQGI